jgi:hypothetical protein
MNCYYSNLIEGHHTHPVEINRALAGDYAAEPEKRNLQREAVAHIEVQRLIDTGAASKRSTSSEFIAFVHRRFCELLPDDLLWVENPETHERVRVAPGGFRTKHVKVGHHTPPSPLHGMDVLGLSCELEREPATDQHRYAACRKPRGVARGCTLRILGARKCT